jgi:hypothetical protein
MDAEPARGESRCVKHRRESQRQHDWEDPQKNILKPYLTQQWVITRDASTAFVAKLEDVPEVYQRPHVLRCPLVCFDESAKQMTIERRAPVPAAPGRKARHDYECERNGVANPIMLFAPLDGWRHVKVSDHHAIDYVHVFWDLSDTHFPGAEKIVTAQDNLSTHTTTSLYAAFPTADVCRLVTRFEWHHTPKHSSWLDMTESELGVLAHQCLDRRIPDKMKLIMEIAAW